MSRRMWPTGESVKPSLGEMFANWRRPVDAVDRSLICHPCLFSLRRKVRADVDKALELYNASVTAQHTVDSLRKGRKDNAATGLSPEERAKQGKALKEKLAAAEAELESLRRQMNAAALRIPCDTHPCSPIGPEEAAVEIAAFGQKPVFEGFTPKDHLALGEHLQLFDFKASTSIAGGGFVVFKNDGVLLEQALINWALNEATKEGFTAIAPPDVAFAGLVEGCGFNPRDDTGASGAGGVSGGGGPPLPSQVYSLNGSDLCLIGTAEIALAGLHANSIFPSPASLPAAYCAISHCFRREAGSNGQRDKGLYRLHQFSKVELFAYTCPKPAADADADADGEREQGLKTEASGEAGSLIAKIAAHLRSSPPSSAVPSSHHHHHNGAPTLNPLSESMFERLVSLQARMYASLGLHFRVLDMPTEELGASAFRKIDIEAWMPCRSNSGSSVTLGAYGEISSASNCFDYQSRRLNVRVKMPDAGASAGAGENVFVHTLNATACAVPRVMLAILETHQQADGSVRIPEPLRPFMGGREFLRPPPRQRR